jgi:CheY-like chemotaxis protein
LGLRGGTQGWPELTLEAIIKRARILVIDDGDFPLMVLFERDGYTIKQWKDIEDLRQLENGYFDLILLDLLGVGLEQSSHEGFGILKHIRKRSPAQIVVAYSNADLSLEYQPFFRDADAVLHKTSDYVSFKRTVDSLLEQRFSLGFFLDRIGTVLGELAPQAPKYRKKARTAILSDKSDPLRKYLANRIEDEVTIDRVIAITGAGAQIASLWKS